MSQPAKPTPVEAFDLLEYDPEAGVLRWKESRPGRMKAGAIAGTENDAGYWIIKIAGKRYKRSRLTWAICKGEDAPIDIEIDHRDLCKKNDRIDNLRLSDHGQNAANRPAIKPSGLPKGVRKVQVNGRTMFEVRLRKAGKGKSRGPYASLEKAIAKADELGTILHGEFWNGAGVAPAKPSIEA